MNQGKVQPIERYYKSLESRDTEFGKVYRFHGQVLRMVAEESFLWSGLLAKSELRQLLDGLFEHALGGGADSQERPQVLEGAASRR